MRGARKPAPKTLRDEAPQTLGQKTEKTSPPQYSWRQCFQKRYLLESPFDNRHVKPWQAGLNGLKPSHPRERQELPHSHHPWIYRWVRQQIERLASENRVCRLSSIREDSSQTCPLGVRTTGARERCFDVSPAITTARSMSSALETSWSRPCGTRACTLLEAKKVRVSTRCL
jgi:hypothetical protein